MKGLTKHLVLDFMQMEQFVADPFIISEGSGVLIRDVDGKEYIDGLSGVFVVSVGHSNPAIAKRVGEQLEKLAFAPPLHATNPAALRLAERLGGVTPPGMKTFKFVSGGSEANEAALKLARQYHIQTGNPRKYKVISRYGSYHGATAGALSATGSWDRKSVFEPLLPGFIHVHPPYCQRCPFDHVYGQCGITCAKLIEATILAEDPDTVAAVVMEPVSVNSSGFVVPPMEYLQAVREICDKYNVLLILDEIITGFGRLGTMFGCEHFGVVPDMICCGKGMSGGYAPLAAVIMQDSIHQAFLGDPRERREFHHGHTYGGNPLACTAGLATLDYILEHDVLAAVKQRGKYLAARLEELHRQFPFVGEPRGVGLLQGFDFVRDRATNAPFPAEVQPGKRFEREAKKRGLIARCGKDFVVFAPPLTITEEEAGKMCDIARESLEAIRDDLMHFAQVA